MENLDIVNAAEFQLDHETLDIKRAKKKLKKDNNSVNQKKTKNYYLTEYVKNSCIYQYMYLMNEYVKIQIAYQYDSATNNMNNDSLRKKYKFFTEEEIQEMKDKGEKVKYPSEQDITEYTDLIYPNINVALFEHDFEKKILEALS